MVFFIGVVHHLVQNLTAGWRPQYGWAVNIHPIHHKSCENYMLTGSCFTRSQLH